MGLWQGHSIFVAMLPHLEQAALFNAVNFDLNIYQSANYTVWSLAPSTLWCPSDSSIRQELRYAFLESHATVGVRYTSYAGNVGTWNFEPFVFNFSERAEAHAQINGMFVPRRPVVLGEVTDGTSHTFLFGERAHGKLTGYALREAHWWPDDVASDTRFWTLAPINPFRKIKDFYEHDYFPAYTSAASSLHPGGANFCFADGSVRFVKETIHTWTPDPLTGYPRGVWQDPDSGVWHIGADANPSVYQALSTRDGGETASEGEY